MKNLNLLIIALLILLLAACQKEETVAPEIPADIAEKLVPLPPLSGEVEADVEMLYQEAGLDEDASKRGPSIKFVPAGSTTGDLAAAIAAAGNGGVVVLLPGMHTENDPVMITHRVTIIGAAGSVLKTGTQAQPNNPDFTINADAFFHIKNTNFVILAGIQMEAMSSTGGGTAILLENANRTYISRCDIREYQFSLLIEQSDHVSVNTNHIDAYDFTLHSAAVHGIVNINGRNNRFINNTITQAFFGIWACDRNGNLRYNSCNANYHGIILCKVPLGSLVLPGGTATGSQTPATNWQASFNTAQNNFDVGIIVIDGATQNFLYCNALSGNGFLPILTGTSPLDYEMELTQNTSRFGFLSPEATFNTVIVGDNTTPVKDCGSNNQILGGVLIPNTSSSPCR